jgi:RimJ/RimL family protein N-acetyltransferase
MRDELRNMTKQLASLLLGEYSAYCIYSFESGAVAVAPIKAVGTDSSLQIRPVDEATISASPERVINEQVGYAGTGAIAYACFDGDRVVAICFYWFGDRYASRNFWPLAEREAKLVQIVALPEVRGRGIATRLISESARDMLSKGFGCLYARVWHSNTPSRRAFIRAGWARIALVLEINPFRRLRPTRICLRSASTRKKD